MASTSTIRTHYVRESKANETECTDIGQHSRISVLMDKISEYFQEKEAINLFLSIVNSESKLSLRVIDFFVTNYARKNEVIYEIINDKKRREKFMVHYSYKAQLKAYSKRQFDPFCRRERINFTIDGLDNDPVEVRTTVGQLNFFRWAIKNGVLDYIDKNLEAIESEMNQSHRKGKKKKVNTTKGGKKVKVVRKKDKLAKATKAKRESESSDEVTTSFTVNTEDPNGDGRKDLTLSTSKTVSKHNVIITVKFD